MNVFFLGAILGTDLARNFGCCKRFCIMIILNYLCRCCFSDSIKYGGNTVTSLALKDEYKGIKSKYY